MLLPTVHLNGTSKAELLSQIEDATAALAEAIRAMEQMTPNGRDYYPQGPTVIHAAIKEHADRINRVQKVRAEITAIAEHLYELP